MNTTLDDPLSPGNVVSLVTRALKDARDLPRFYGLVRGLEIGMSTLSNQKCSRDQSIESLQPRRARLAESNDQYQVGVALGIDLTIDLARLLTLRSPLPACEILPDFV